MPDPRTPSSERHRPPWERADLVKPHTGSSASRCIGLPLYRIIIRTGSQSYDLLLGLTRKTCSDLAPDWLHCERRGPDRRSPGRVRQTIPRRWSPREKGQWRRFRISGVSTSRRRSSPELMTRAQDGLRPPVRRSSLKAPPLRSGPSGEPRTGLCFEVITRGRNPPPRRAVLRGKLEREHQ